MNLLNRHKNLATIFSFILIMVAFTVSCGSDSSVGEQESGKIHHVPAEFATIQEAIDFAREGETVLVSPGTYIGPVNFKGRDIIVISSNGPLRTIITGPDSLDLVLFKNGETNSARIEGFHIKNGRIGILCENSAPTIRHNILTGQHITNWGAISLGGDGYATIGNSPAVIENNTIVSCANGGISTFSSTSPTIKNNIISFNNHYGIHREGLQNEVAQPNLSYNCVYGNAVAYQEIANPGTGTITSNPMLTSDYQLQAGSPCVNGGDPDAEYTDPDGSRNDMGAINSGH